jgi:hypothetical protein
MMLMDDYGAISGTAWKDWGKYINRGQMSQCPCQDSNLAHTNYKSEADLVGDIV